VPKFRFSLQAVLDQREREERDRQVAVAAVERERMRLEERLRACQAALRLERREQAAALGAPGAAGPSGAGAGRPGRVDLSALRGQIAASMRLLAEAQRIALELAGVLRRLEGARAELLRARTRRRAVELLRERRYEQWRLDEIRRDAAATDEIGVMRAGRSESVA